MISPIVSAFDVKSELSLPGSRRRTVLKDVSFELMPGESAAILGRSGSGKTTLLTHLGLMARPTSGKIVISGRDVAQISDSEAADLRNELIGFVFQSYSLVPHLSVYENIALPIAYMKNKGKRRRATRSIADLLAAVGLTGRERDRPAALSGGEQQRVAIARALVARPPIILADEPTGALDFDTGGQILDLMRDASTDRGTSLIVVTHDAEVARSLDRQFELVDGILRERKSS